MPLVGVNMELGHTIGIDLGGTNVRVALVDSINLVINMAI